MSNSPIMWLGDQLFTMGLLSDLLIWVVVLLFAIAGGLEWYVRRSGTARV